MYWLDFGIDKELYLEHNAFFMGCLDDIVNHFPCCIEPQFNVFHVVIEPKGINDLPKLKEFAFRLLKTYNILFDVNDVWICKDNEIVCSAPLFPPN